MLKYRNLYSNRIKNKIMRNKIKVAGMAIVIAGVLCFAFGTSQALAQSAGPVAHYKFDEGSGSTAANSGSAGASVNGTLISGSSGGNTSVSSMWEPAGKYGSAIEFDGTNDYVDMGTANNLRIGDFGSRVTIEAWIYWRGNSVGLSRIGGFQGYNGDYALWTDGRINGTTGESYDRILFEVDGRNGNALYSPIETLEKNSWHHIVGTFEAGSMKIYIDGEPIAEDTTLYYPPTEGTARLRFGNNENVYFDGLIDDIRIYNYSRTRAQILEDMYNETVELPAHYEFNEGSGSVAANAGSSGVSLNGTLDAGIGGANADESFMWDLGGKSGAIEFDGTDDQVMFSSPAPMTSAEFTVSAWYKSSDCVVGGTEGVNDEYIYRSHSQSADADYITLGPTDDGSVEGNDDNQNLRLVIDASGNNQYYGTSDIVDGEWHYLAATRGDGKIKIYVDGIKEGEYDDPDSSVPVSYIHTQNYIGNFPGEPNPVHGLVDDLRIYGTVLTHDQILEYMGETPVTGAPICSGAAVGGLWGSYSLLFRNPSGVEYKKEVRDVAVENVNFDKADYKNTLFDRLGEWVGTSEGGTRYRAEIVWEGAIKTDVTGTYNFRAVTNGQTTGLSIDDVTLWSYRSDLSAFKQVNLSAGWHKIRLSHSSSFWQTDPAMKLYWTPPGGPEQIIPANHLKHEHWADNVIEIPASGKAKVSYVTAGVGARKAVESGSRPSIVIDLPEGVEEKDVLKNDVWIHWSFLKSGTGVSVKNEKTGSPIVSVQDSTELKTANGISTKGYIARIPASLFDEASSSRRLDFSFGGFDSGKGGISLIVPYIDENAPEGKIIFNMTDVSGYGKPTPAVVYSLGVNDDRSKIAPVFFLVDGETKLLPNGYRPNAIYMLSGEGAPPAEDAFLPKMAGNQLLLPGSGPIDMNNPSTWYPNFGRDGMSFDVISHNYVYNQWANASTVESDYVGMDDGKINYISIPASHDWIAFQYIGTDFDLDGINSIGDNASHYGPESGNFSGGGLFSTVEPNHFELQTSITGNGSLTSNPSGIDCPSGSCIATFNENADVVLTAAWNPLMEELSWSGGGCSGGSFQCTVSMDQNKSVTAIFTPIVPVSLCGGSSGKIVCRQPESDFCASGSDLAGVLVPNANGWDWTCRRSSDGAEENCSAEKIDCSWKEVAPGPED